MGTRVGIILDFKPQFRRLQEWVENKQATTAASSHRSLSHNIEKGKLHSHVLVQESSPLRRPTPHAHIMTFNPATAQLGRHWTGRRREVLNRPKQTNPLIPVCRLLPVRRRRRGNRLHRRRGLRGRHRFVPRGQVRDIAVGSSRRRGPGTGRSGGRHGPRKKGRREDAAAGDADSTDRILAGAAWYRRRWSLWKAG
jgi:hypothetical protein